MNSTPTYDTMQEVLHSPFDIDTHNATFTDYCEVIIFPDGTIEYAVPSHQEKLIKIACEANKWTRHELSTKCPEEYYFDFMEWLTILTNCVVLSTTTVQFRTITPKQIAAIKMLENSGAIKLYQPLDTIIQHAIKRGEIRQYQVLMED